MQTQEGSLPGEGLTRLLAPLARWIDDTVFGLIDLYVFHTLRFFVTYTPVAVMLFILSGASLLLGPAALWLVPALCLVLVE